MAEGYEDVCDAKMAERVNRLTSIRKRLQYISLGKEYLSDADIILELDKEIKEYRRKIALLKEAPKPQLFQYGDSVKDAITGFKGTITGFCYYYHHRPNCYMVEANDDTNRPVTEWIDEERLVKYEDQEEY